MYICTAVFSMQKPAADSVSFTMNNQPIASPDETTCNTSAHKTYSWLVH